MSGKRGGRRLAWALLTVGLAAASTGGSVEAAPPLTPPRIFVFGTELPRAMEYGLVVEQDAEMPDMALLTLNGSAARAFAGRVRIGDPVSVTSPATPAASLFTGEVVAVERGCEVPDRVVVRALNRLHRLAAAPRTRAFFDVSDGEIVATVAAEHGLAAAAGVELQERHEAVYQHNQTDLEFLSERAAQIGYEVWVEDTKLILGHPRAGGTIHPETFYPRLSSSVTVRKVVVRGWDPQRRREIVGQAASPAIILGEAGSQGTALGATEEFTVDHPIFSVEEAMAIAQAKRDELTASHVSAEAEVVGSAALRAVTVEGSGEPFNGKYLVRGVSHRYTHSPDDSGGYRTMLKLSRQDHGLFFVPDVDDEVLVAFEHGDLRRPYVVGSLWDGGGDACSTDRPPQD